MVNLDGSQQSTTKELLIEFQDIFSEGNKDLDCTNVLHYTINTGDASPINQHARRLPISKRDKVFDAITDMHHQGIIKPPLSHWT